MRNIILSFILFGSFLGFSENKSCFYRIENSQTNAPKPIIKINNDKFVTISKTCAPWDGAALTIIISETKQDCDDIKAPFINVNIWKSITDVSGKTFNFPDEKLGRVIKSVSKDKYLELKEGKISFEEKNDSHEVIFKIEFEFENGEKIKDTFKAKWCSKEYLCG